ncbi:hypothetical protein BKA69DRAFT_1099338 [Paraphysoderma sedebokerense]|nr:hypothetical protein BKA69DRAFT_1099338 [Paraphysoderma sedebokerense]
MTFMKGVKNYFIFGEIGGVKIADEEMVDVYTGAYEDANRRIESKENKRRLPGNDERGNIAKRSPQGEHGDEPFDRINTVMPTNEHSHDLGAEGHPHKDELHTLSSSHKSVDEAVSATHNDSTLPPESHDFYSIHKRSVKEVPQFNQFPSKIDKDRQPDKKNQGWKLDAHKNLPALRAMYYRFPTAKWYIMIDDDTYLFMENLHHRLSKYNHNLPIYIGFPNHFVGCDGIKKYGTGPPFAHGGSGIVISRGAMLKVIDHIDECTLKYKDCWAGDVRIGLCLRDNGVNISFPLSGRQIFNPNTPHYQMHNYSHDPCKRVVSFHHLRPATMQKLYNIERYIHSYTVKAYSNSESTPPGFSIPSPYYSPVHLEDIWHTFVDADEEVPDYDENAYRRGKILKKLTAPSWQECGNICREYDKCRSWSWENESVCYLQEGVSLMYKRNGSYSGIVKGRFKCRNRTL